jgi:hypothetical protein
VAKRKTCDVDASVIFIMLCSVIASGKIYESDIDRRVSLPKG